MAPSTYTSPPVIAPHEGACFNPVRNHVMLDAMHLLNALDPNHTRARTANFGTHRIQVIR